MIEVAQILNYKLGQGIKDNLQEPQNFCHIFDNPVNQSNTGSKVNISRTENPMALPDM